MTMTKREIVLPPLPGFIAESSEHLKNDFRSYARAAVEADREAGRSAPVAWIVYLPSMQTQEIFDSQEDAGYVDWLTNYPDAVVTPLYTGSAPVVEPDSWIADELEAEMKRLNALMKAGQKSAPAMTIYTHLNSLRNRIKAAHAPSTAAPSEPLAADRCVTCGITKQMAIPDNCTRQGCSLKSEPPVQPTAVVSGVEPALFVRESELRRFQQQASKLTVEWSLPVTKRTDGTIPLYTTASTAPAAAKLIPSVLGFPPAPPAAAIKLPLLPNGAQVIVRDGEAFVRISDLQAVASPDVAKMVDALHDAVRELPDRLELDAAIDALGAAAAQAKASVSAEPVAWQVKAENGTWGPSTTKKVADHWASRGYEVRPLAVAPQPPKD